MLYTVNVPYIFDPDLLRARAGDLDRLAEEVDRTRGAVLGRLSAVGRHSSSTASLSALAREARARARDLEARAAFVERNGYFDAIGIMPALTAGAMTSLGAEDPALLTALIGELDRRIDSWPGTDNDPIFDQLLAARAELRGELAFFVEVNAALSEIRSALDTGGWGVRRNDLFGIRDTFDRLTPRGADEVMNRLTERELDVWVDQMQEGTLKGGLKKHERIALLAMVLPKLSPAQLRRLEARSRNVNPPLADGHDYDYVLFEGDLFVLEDGIAIRQSDVDQGSLGDCYFIASLAAVASVDPAVIERSVSENANGTFTVTLYPDGTPVEIVVTPTFPAEERSGEFVPVYANNSQEAVGGRRELWPLAYEKALAIYEESYEDIEGGRAYQAMEWVTGAESVHIEPPDFTFDELKAEFESGHAISLSSLSGSDANTYPIKDDDPATAGTKDLFYGHAYIVTGVTDSAVVVRNPHGVETEFEFTYDELAANFKRIDINRIGGPD